MLFHALVFYILKHQKLKFITSISIIICKHYFAKKNIYYCLFNITIFMTIKALYQLFLASPIVCTDTRNIKKNSIFFALKGDSFNGNLFALQAIEQGCAYAIVDEEIEQSDKVIKVENVLQTLQELATYHRQQLHIPIIGITGSNGKTTTKELVQRVLQKRYNTYATFGNLNNHIGVPLSLLSITNQHEMAVIEMGANHKGEIAMLCNICLPNYGLITNIGKAHLEGFGGEEGVIIGKSELYKFIRKTNGLLFINNDDELLKRLSRGIDSYTYGSNNTANIYAEMLLESPTLNFKINDAINVTSTLSGRYNLNNIMAAITIGTYFKITLNDAADAVATYVSDNNRSQIVNTKSNSIFLDAYNANPSSMQAAISNFCSQHLKNKIAIIGGMNELGETSELEHTALVNQLYEQEFSHIYLVGKYFSHIIPNANATLVENTTLLTDILKQMPIVNSNILIKGSRTNKLEQLVDYL